MKFIRIENDYISVERITFMRWERQLAEDGTPAWRLRLMVDAYGSCYLYGATAEKLLKSMKLSVEPLDEIHR